jgi:hypothetical protein
VNRERPVLSPAHLTSGSRGPRPIPPQVRGSALDGGELSVDLTGPGFSLLVFLGPRCNACIELWDALATPDRYGLGHDDRLVAVLGAEGPDPSWKRVPIPSTVSVLVAPREWEAWAVLGAPFCAAVGGAPVEVLMECVPWDLAHLAAQVATVVGLSRTS